MSKHGKKKQNKVKVNVTTKVKQNGKSTDEKKKTMDWKDFLSTDWQQIGKNVVIILGILPFSIVAFIINGKEFIDSRKSIETMSSETTEAVNSELPNDIISTEQIEEILIVDDYKAENDTPHNFLELNHIEDDLAGEEVPIETNWIDLFQIPEYVRTVSEQEKISAYKTFYNKIIQEKKNNINVDEKITQEYIKFVIEANDIFSEYDDDADRGIKNNIIDEASEQRYEAKKEYRQTSNEQILANWYALCGKNYYEDELAGEEFVYYNYAIDMYLDGYSVSLVKGEEPKIIALDYITTCFLNIYNNRELDEAIRLDALYSAAAFDEMYRDMLLQYDKNPNQMSQKEHGVHMDLGEIYIWLCKAVPQEDKMYYYELAYQELTQCPQYSSFGKKLANRVYNDLIYLTQYCYDNVEKQYYPEGITKQSLRILHSDFECKLEKYE